MARRESDREDLMREATALKRRVELRIPGEPETVIAGVRSGGALSLYFGPDPVYHFDAETGLRRAFMDGCLYRTQGTTLARLTRVRREDSTDLRRHDLDDDELRAFRDRAQPRLKHLHEALADGTEDMIEHVPPQDDLRPELRERIGRALAAGIPLAPPIKGKR